MFQDIKNAVRKEQRIRTLILAGFGVLSLVFGISFAMHSTADGFFRRMGLSAVAAPAFLIAAVLSALLPRRNLRKMMIVLNANSDDDMDSILRQAEPLEQKNPPMLWLTAEHVINFDSVQAYEIRSIRKIEKKTCTDSDYNTTDYRIILKLSGNPSKDTIIVPSHAERERICTRLMQAYQPYGNPGELL